MKMETVIVNNKHYEVVQMSPTDFIWLNPSVQMPTDEELAEWWKRRREAVEENIHYIELDREDAEELCEYLDEIEIPYTAQAECNKVTVKYMASGDNLAKVREFIQWQNSDERYYAQTGCAWDV